MSTENNFNTGDSNNLSPKERIWAGILLVTAICIPIVAIVKMLPDTDKRLDNGVLLILVACAGFLGTAIHIANSFTAFVGSGTFKRSWRLWYFVMPFTGAALALILFFAFGSSLMPDKATGSAYIQGVYKVFAISGLAGMFTDITTMKLKDIFVSILNPKDERTGKMNPSAGSNSTNDTFKITGIDTPKLNKGVNTITLSGKALMSKKVTLKINDQVLANPKITETTIVFDYNLQDGVTPPFHLTVNDETGKPVYETQLAA